MMAHVSKQIHRWRSVLLCRVSLATRLQPIPVTVTDPSYRFIASFWITPCFSGLPISPGYRAIERAIKPSSERTSERAIEEAIERATERANERVSERAFERSSDRVSEGAIERSGDRASDRAIDRAIERSSDREIERATE